ncbi:uncharacterized protein LOC111389376 [Olea europaea var. sylvestris]|uniref:uncharacterized protein LOC111389376 n=1 Tax=Olea europaea var. sylvestris TaxID=158386 RepID=UPI000C1D6A89|nr:uncharacterized protein LOC111389376 [Olea europaea var. sylvestris]
MTTIGTLSSQNGSNNMETAPAVQEGENNRESIIALNAWKHSDILCKNYIINVLDNTLYGVYSSKESAKELWDSLKTKYKTENAGTKKFIVGKFLDYKMVDSKIVIIRVQEIQVLLHDIHVEKMELSESFQVTAIIEKLPPMWRDFKNYLKHKRKEMNLEELIVRLRIEEDNRKTERRLVDQDGANFVEMEPNAINKKQKAPNYVPRRDNSKKAKKFKGNCYNCGKVGHHSSECSSQRRMLKPTWLQITLYPMDCKK